MTAIETRALGAQGAQISRLALGTMMFGDRTGEDEAARIMETYGAAGGNFIDTADAYAAGASERMVGRLVAQWRDRPFIATKGGNKAPGIDDEGGIGPERIMRAARLSRERLGIEQIDLYYLHRDDDVTPLDETIGALGALMNEGAIAHWGFSNFRPWKIAEMVRVADRLGVARPVAAQPYYHLLNRTAEPDLIPACRHFGIGVVCYSPLARGVLTGKYGQGAPEESRAARGDRRMLETEFQPETIARAAKLTGYARSSGRDPAALAIGWVLANQAVTSVLAGPRTKDQLDAYLAALPVSYTGQDEAFLSGLCAPGHIPVPEQDDPRYPIDGRRTEPLT